MNYLVLNLKNYEKAFDKNCIKILSLLEKFAKKLRKTKIILAPQILDLKECSKKSKKVWIFSQHVDSVKEKGKFTGHILPYFLKKIGVKGSIVNHSEKRLNIKTIKETIEVLKYYKLFSLVCAANLKEAKIINSFKPDFIAFEVPELIGTGKSISRFKPKSVEKFVKLCKNAIPLCGAGISSEEDVEKALELGTKGVLIASAFVKSKNKKVFLKKVLKVMENYEIK